MTEVARILLVGSHPVLTARAAEMLRKAGWSTTAALGPEAGLEALKQESFDALILGGPLALEAGAELAEALHARNPWAPVVVPEGPEGLVRSVEKAFGEVA